MVKYLNLIRFQNLLIMVLIQYLLRYSIIIPAYGEDNVLGNLHFSLLVFSMILIAAGGYVINDYFDIQIDAKNENVTVGRSIKRRTALILHTLLSTTGVSLGFYIAYVVDFIFLGAIMAIASYILWEYSLRLKRLLVIDNFIIATLIAFFVLSLSAFEILPKIDFPTSQYTLTILCIYASFAFMTTLMHETIKDLRSIQGDKEFKIRTLPTVWGINKTKEFVKWLSVLTAFMIVAISVSLFKNEIPTLSYALVLLIAPLFLLNIWIYKAENKQDYDRIANLNKFIIFAGIMSLCFFI